MSYWRQFDEFNPKEGKVPYYPFSSLQDIVHRTRYLLRDRTEEEIRAAAQFIDWMIEDYFEQEIECFIQDQIDNDGWAKSLLLEAQEKGNSLCWYVKHDLPKIAGDDDYLDYASDENTSEVAALKECIGNYHIEDQDFPEGTQAECFAVLALWMVADCIRWLGRTTGKGSASEGNSTRANFSLAGESALMAMDAISHAELLQKDEQHRSEIQQIQIKGEQEKKDVEERAALRMAQRRSESARKAAAKRHEEHASMREEVIAHYEQHKDDYTSTEDAARKIANVIVPVAHRTVVKWLSAHKRRQLD